MAQAAALRSQKRAAQSPRSLRRTAVGKAPPTSGDAATPEDQAQSTASANPKGDKRTRSIRKDRLPENLPVRTEEIIPEIVQANPEAWRNCGFEEKTQLEKEPAYFYLRRILRMKQGMLASRYVRADETFIRYLDRTIPGGSSNGYFWVYRGLTGDVIFDWQTSREHRHASEWLGPDYEGILQSDGYQAYENHCRVQRARDKTVLRAACLAHIRRKFENARAERPEVIDRILRIITRLYMIEKPLR
jgi:hypothetical protein